MEEDLLCVLVLFSLPELLTSRSCFGEIFIGENFFRKSFFSKFFYLDFFLGTTDIQLETLKIMSR